MAEFRVIWTRIASISRASSRTVATLHRFRMSEYSRTRSLGERSLESFTPRSSSASSDNTATAATTSGPSTEPFPASSTPQIT